MMFATTILQTLYQAWAEHQLANLPSEVHTSKAWLTLEHFRLKKQFSYTCTFHLQANSENALDNSCF